MGPAIVSDGEGLDGSDRYGKESTIWFETISLHLKKNVLYAAHRLCTKAVRVHPHEIALRNLLETISIKIESLPSQALQLLRQSRNHEARQCINEYLSIKPNDPSALALAARIQNLHCAPVKKSTHSNHRK